MSTEYFPSPTTILCRRSSYRSRNGGRYDINSGKTFSTVIVYILTNKQQYYRGFLPTIQRTTVPERYIKHYTFGDYVSFQVLDWVVDFVGMLPIVHSDQFIRCNLERTHLHHMNLVTHVTRSVHSHPNLLPVSCWPTPEFLFSCLSSGGGQDTIDFDVSRRVENWNLSSSSDMGSEPRKISSVVGDSFKIWRSGLVQRNPIQMRIFFRKHTVDRQYI